MKCFSKCTHSKEPLLSCMTPGCAPQAICCSKSARFKSKKQSHKFQKKLNKLHELIQLTIEDENEEKSLKNNEGRYEFHVYRKPVHSEDRCLNHTPLPREKVLFPLWPTLVIKLTTFQAFPPKNRNLRSTPLKK